MANSKEEAKSAVIWTQALVKGRAVEAWIAEVTEQQQRQLTRLHAREVVRCYVDLELLRALAIGAGTTERVAFRNLLPTKAHLRNGDFGEILMRSLLQART